MYQLQILETSEFMTKLLTGRFVTSKPPYYCHKFRVALLPSATPSPSLKPTSGLPVGFPASMGLLFWLLWENRVVFHFYLPESHFISFLIFPALEAAHTAWLPSSIFKAKNGGLSPSHSTSVQPLLPSSHLICSIVVRHHS